MRKTGILLIGFLLLPVVARAGTGLVTFEGAITLTPNISASQTVNFATPSSITMIQGISPASVGTIIPIPLRGQSIGAASGSMALSGLATMQNIQTQMFEGLMGGPSAQGIASGTQQLTITITGGHNLLLILP